MAAPRTRCLPFRSPATGMMHQLSKMSSSGSVATHLALDSATQTLFVAHYGSGQVSALPILADDSLAAVASVRRDYGFWAQSLAEDSARACRSRRSLAPLRVVVDLGADRFFVYRFDAAARQLTQADPAYEAVIRGAGPYLASRCHGSPRRWRMRRVSFPYVRQPWIVTLVHMLPS